MIDWRYVTGRESRILWRQYYSLSNIKSGFGGRGSQKLHDISNKRPLLHNPGLPERELEVAHVETLHPKFSPIVYQRSEKKFITVLLIPKSYFTNVQLLFSFIKLSSFWWSWQNKKGWDWNLLENLTIILWEPFFQYPFSKKVQTQTVNSEKLLNKLKYDKVAHKMLLKFRTLVYFICI